MRDPGLEAVFDVLFRVMELDGSTWRGWKRRDLIALMDSLAEVAGRALAEYYARGGRAA